MQQLNLVLQYKKQKQQIYPHLNPGMFMIKQQWFQLAELMLLVFYNNTLIAGTNSGLYSFDGNTWQPYLNLAGNKIIDLLSDGNSLYILTPTKSLYL